MLEKLRRVTRYLPNVLRLATFLVVVSLLGLYVTARVVRGRLERRMLALGHEMLAYELPPARGPAGPVRQLELNGARVDFASGTSSEPLEQFLAARGCRAAGEPTGAASAGDAGATGAAGGDGGAARAPDGPLALREQNGRSGYVACFDPGSGGVDPVAGDLFRRLEAAARTGDVTELGRLRYLYAERGARGGTRYIGFRSDSRVNVYEMFPESGDAPGRDVPDVPRPPGSRRTLSAMELGDHYAMATYAGALPRGAVEAFYRRELARRGWVEIPMRGAVPAGVAASAGGASGGGGGAGALPLLSFERAGPDGGAVSIVVDAATAGETCVVVLLERAGAGG